MKNKPAKISQKGFIPIPLLVLFLIISTGAVALKVAERAHVLGTSVLLAENGDGTGPAGGDTSGGGSGSPGSGGGGGNPQPQQQSAPQQQPQQQNQPQQPPQNSQNSGPAGSGSGGPGPNNPNPGTPQVNNRPLNLQNNTNQQNPNPGTPQKDFRPPVNQQNSGPGGSGSGPGGPGSNNPNPGTPQDDSRRSLNSQNSGPAGSGRGGPGSENLGGQQKFQQLEQQWQQEATKFGFQIQNPTNQGDNSGPGDQGNLSNGQLPPLNSFPSIQGSFNVQGGTGGGEQIDLNDGNTRVDLGSLRAVRPDGTKVEIDKDAREKIQAVIKLETGSEFSQSGNTFRVKRGEVSASTDLPVSFNIATKTFTVQTANGEQEVNVLPDQAVAKIAESNANFSADSDGVKLVELNDEPVFEIPGTSRQRFFGFIPIGIQQTSLVSAKDGNLLTTNQSVLSRIVDTFSF